MSKDKNDNYNKEFIYKIDNCDRRIGLSKLLNKRIKHLFSYKKVNNKTNIYNTLTSNNININNKSSVRFVIGFKEITDKSDNKYTLVNIVITHIDRSNNTFKVKYLLSTDIFFIKTLYLISNIKNDTKSIKTLKAVITKFNHNSYFNYILKDRVLFHAFYNKYKTLIESLIIKSLKFKPDNYKSIIRFSKDLTIHEKL